MKEMVAWVAIVAALSLPAFTVWYAVVALLVRPFGIRVPLLIWRKGYKKAVGHLSRFQYTVFAGVLGFGVGTQLLYTLMRYLESSRFGPEVPFHESLGLFAARMICCMLASGLLFWLSWRPSSPDSDPFAGNDSLIINPKPRS